MKQQWITTALAVALVGLVAAPAAAQNRDSERSKRELREQYKRTAQDKEKNSEIKDQQDRSRDGRLGEDEARLRYNDEKNRLSIDVDEDIQFRDDRDRSGRDRGWTRDGEFELRYDSDRHDLKASGEGTVDVDRAASGMARWWQSWWDEERSARRSRQQGSESGARVFVRQHDDDSDGYVSRRELPDRLRNEFDRADRDEDGYLSQSEVRRYGDELYASSQRSNRGNIARRGQRPDDDQTWSQWWSSWWSDEDGRGVSRDQLTADGARRFIRKFDQNGDGYLVRSEMPDRMYDDFNRLDANGDRYLIRSEIQQHARRMYDQRAESASREEDSRR